MRYVATVRFEDGRECIVFPRSKKTNTYPSAASAIKALDKWGRKNLRHAHSWVQGRVKLNDEIVWTVAL